MAIELYDESYTASADRYALMPFNRLGRSGLKLPAVSLGLWQNFGAEADPQRLRMMCRTAFDRGITHFDLANNYGPPPGAAEEQFSHILVHDFKSHRDELIISTKAGFDMWPGPYGNWGSRKYLLASLDQSLKRMKLDYVDIFYHHRMDPDTPLEESMSALATAVESGRALYAGISNYNAETLVRSAAILTSLNCPFVINQVRYSILDRRIEEDGLKDAAARLGIGLIAYSPLAQGLLTDHYLSGIPEGSRASRSQTSLSADLITDERRRVLVRLNDIARDRGQSLAQLALSWVLRDGRVSSVLIGASSPEQIVHNIEAAGKTEFSIGELEEIDELSRTAALN